MKKQDFIKAVASKCKLSQDAVSGALNTMIDVITSELKA
jgi:nucleoid DNA-binding protein